MRDATHILINERDWRRHVEEGTYLNRVHLRCSLIP
jgi:hypothetical protein